MNEQKKVERIFDAWAPTYERSAWYMAQGEIVLRHLPAEVDGAVLDVGCGTGWLLRRAVQAREGLRAVGVDLSPRMIDVASEAAEREGAGRIRFHCLDWESVDPESLRPLGPFGAAICVSSLHYFSDPTESLRKIRSLLSPGGILLLLDRDTESSILTRAWNVLHRVWIRDHVRFHASDELQRMMAAAGFERVCVLHRVNRFFWHGKVVAGLVLLCGQVGQAAALAAGA